MYKLLFCWRYLRTRFIALASVISVMLGVATMIVVNSVMEGFTHEMQDRIHGILSDLVVESHSVGGVRDPEWHMEQIRRVAGDYIEAMTPTVHVPAMLTFEVPGQFVTRPVQLIGIDENTQALTGDFAKYLQHPGHRKKFDFRLPESGFDTVDSQAEDPTSRSAQRPQLENAGWRWRRRRAAMEKMWRQQAEAYNTAQKAQAVDSQTAATETAVATTTASEPAASNAPADPFAARAADEASQNVFDPATQQHPGVVLGILLSSYRDNDGQDRFLVLPGDDIKLTFPTAGSPPRAIDDAFTVVDFYECKMSEYDQSFVFVPLKKLQQLRGMIDPSTGVGYFTSIQIKLKNDRDGELVREKLRGIFAPEMYSVQTWRDKQGPLLAAVQMETAILNVLLFLIIAVAGFGILAIFFMIVVEKTRDIGILKSLGASRRGIMGIFLGYGLSLGMVGSGVGMVMGLLFVAYINEIADLLGWVTGQEVFDPKIYYFNRIPTIVEPFTVTWIVLGALVIAVLASVLPARRAAGLHPVEALRYE
jgi:lipoprotein-releasing system permease protein